MAVDGPTKVQHHGCSEVSHNSEANTSTAAPNDKNTSLVASVIISLPGGTLDWSGIVCKQS
jgi:hypothetical protein